MPITRTLHTRLGHRITAFCNDHVGDKIALHGLYEPENLELLLDLIGRIKEPVLVYTSGFRGLGCKVAIKKTDRPNQVIQSNNQQPLNAYSVFNFFPPNHRTQGTNVLAPEQKMLNSIEFSDRMTTLTYSFQDDSLLSSAGCDVEAFIAAKAVSDEKLLDLINDRFFRGALPASITKSLLDANKNFWNRNKGLALTGSILDMASITPAYGVSK